MACRCFGRGVHAFLDLVVKDAVPASAYTPPVAEEKDRNVLETVSESVVARQRSLSKSGESRSKTAVLIMFRCPTLLASARRTQDPRRRPC